MIPFRGNYVVRIIYFSLSTPIYFPNLATFQLVTLGKLISLCLNFLTCNMRMKVHGLKELLHKESIEAVPRILQTLSKFSLRG